MQICDELFAIPSSVLMECDVKLLQNNIPLQYMVSNRWNVETQFL
jgi:hypothetical protein